MNIREMMARSQNGTKKNIEALQQARGGHKPHNHLTEGEPGDGGNTCRAV